jgi:membrane fusion protein, multidrug efflux system
MKKGIRILLWIAGAAAVIAGIAFVLAENKQAAKQEIEKDTAIQPFTVTATRVQEHDFSTATSFPGTAMASAMIQIYSECDGKLVQSTLEKGKYIRKGETIGVVDQGIRQINARLNGIGVERAKAEYDNALTNNSRYEALLKENNATVAEVEQTRLQLKNALLQWQSAQQQLTLTQKQVRQTIIRAPISGILIDKKGYTGDFVQPGTILGTIADLNVMVVKVFVPEADVVRLQPGIPVVVTADIFPGAIFKGKIKLILPVANEAGAFPVEVELANNQSVKLMSGMRMQVSFTPNATQRVLAIPRTAINGDFAHPFVYVIDTDKQPVKKTITTGRDLGTHIEVLAGLAPNEIIITNGQANIGQGKRLQAYVLTTDSLPLSKN